MSKIISLSLSPNTQRDDISLAFNIIFSPLKWKEGKEIKELENTFKNKFSFKNAFSFNSGRSSLIAILNSMKISRGDEIIVQAFTCNAAVNPIISVGAKPVFVDINDALNIDSKKIKEKITAKTKAVMIQHTFGYPAQIDEIKKICEDNNIYLIEDCAHALGAKYKDRYCGSFGDASFFSFGRDKVISSVYGGMVVVNNDKLTYEVIAFKEKIEQPSSLWILQQLLHPVLMNMFVLPLYGSIIGKALLAGFLNLSILSKAVTKQENVGVLPNYFPKRMPNGLATLALNQIKKIDIMNGHREEIAELYRQSLERNDRFKIVFKKDDNIKPVFLKFPVLVYDQKRAIERMRENNIYLNDGWMESVVAPPKTSLDKVCYFVGSCPRAEKIVKAIVSLPTHVNISRYDAEKIIKCLIG
ncbi:MAG: aminotransferase class V-fold PLP-dependent enzyme [Candidatus Pacebacteria bacterium]|nr:aminotransferase class V-fold PLP-dependent enzyme [Candidatus Paceibacterota bacterium]